MSNLTDERCVWFKSVGFTTNQYYKFGEMPLVAAFGLIGQSLILKAYYEQAKKESAYWYQILLTLTEIAVIITRAMFVIMAYILSGFDDEGVAWFRSCYFCMWLRACIIGQIENMFVTAALLLTIAMSADRCFAMWKPFVYKNINHKRHQMIASAICLGIGVSTGIFDMFRLSPGLGENGLYIMNANVAFTTSVTAVALAQLRNVIRAVATLILISCNAGLIILYRKYVKKVEGVANSVEIKKKREQQKILMILAVTESVFNTVAMSSLIMFYAMLYTVPSFNECEKFIVNPISDMIQDVAFAGDCFVVFAVSKSFRKMIYESVPCLRRFATVTTKELTVSTSNISNARVTSRHA